MGQGGRGTSSSGKGGGNTSKSNKGNNNTSSSKKRYRSTSNSGKRRSNTSKSKKQNNNKSTPKKGGSNSSKSRYGNRKMPTSGGGNNNNESYNEEADQNNVQTAGKAKEDRDKKKKQNQPEKTKKKIKIVTFILTHLGIFGPIIIFLLAVLAIMGIIGFFTTLPGLYLEQIKDFGIKIWGDWKGFFTGDNITAKIKKEDQIALAQRIEDMGYDIVGYGFADVKYEYDDEPDSQEIEGEVNKQIIDINQSIDGRNYLQAYIAQAEATYIPSIWSIMGFFESVVDKVEGLFSNESRTQTTNKNAKAYSAGMINIKTSGIGERYVSIDRENKILKIEMRRSSNFFMKDTFLFGMEDWTSRYGKPIELFLSLHLGTMMPDLTYDLATEDAFNTKVNIELQRATATYKVMFDKDGTEDTRIMQDAIEKDYLKIMYGMSDEEIKRFEDAGKLDDAFALIIEKTKDYETCYLDLYEGAVIDLTTEHYKAKGSNLAEVEEELLGEKHSTFNVKERYNESVPIQDTEGFTEDTPAFNEDGTPIMVEQTAESDAVQDKILRYEGLDSETAKSRLDASGLAGISLEQLDEFKELILNGREKANTYLPRITTVNNHWYYSYVNFVYGRATRAKKKTEYIPEAEDSTLTTEQLNGGKIVLDQTFEDDSGVGGIFYQLCEPEVDGPNEAIKALFKGGSGEFYGAHYDFSGEYYRYDGTRATALRIANAKASDAGESQFEFLNTTYNTASKDNEEWNIEKQPVTFLTEDEEGNKSYTDAFSALAILENTHTQEAEYVYRNLKHLLIKLKYFTKEDFMKPLVQILLWPVESVGSDNIAQEDNSELTKGITRQENEYGLFLKNGEAFQTGENIIAPGDAIVVSASGNSVKLKFKSLTSETIQELENKFGKDYFTPEADIVLDMEMTITGINPSVSSGATVSRGQVIGTGAEEDIRIILANIDKSLVEDIENYMYPVYEQTVEDDFINGRPNSGQPNLGNNDYWGDIVDNITNPTDPTDTTFDPDYRVTDVTENQRMIYEALIRAGATQAGACGALGNIQQESGFNPNALNSSSGAYGIVQWLGVRRTRLQLWCNANNYQYNSIDGQLAFFIFEIQAYYPHVWNTLTTSNNVIECSDKFQDQYEVCQDSRGRRRTYANAFMIKFAD